MTVLSLDKFRITRKSIIQFALKLIFFMAMLTLVLTKSTFAVSKLSFILFVCLLVVFFYNLIFCKQLMSMRRRILVAAGNFCLLGGFVMLMLLTNI